jgi:beta-glucosidase
LLESWYPGEQGGSAIARVLFGDADPSGRLPVSFPATESGTPTAGDPLSYPGVADRTVYKEGVLVGYRWYDAHHVAPAFPFGFGLSYTHFAYGPLRVTAVRTRAAVPRLSLPIANDGGRPGVEVPQLYVHIPPPGRGLSEPPWQLRGFRRVSLGSGARATVTFTLTARDLAFWSAQEPSWRVGPGCYPVFVGSSSRTARRTGAIAVGTARCPGAAAHIGLPSAEAAARSLL